MCLRPFSHKIVTFGDSDVIMMKNRHMHIQKLHK